MSSQFKKLDAPCIRENLTDLILPFWEKYSRDEKTQSFYSNISSNNACSRKESCSVVMISRFLWSYSAAASFLNDKNKLGMADFAYRLLMRGCYDPEFGGFFWSVNSDGKPDVIKKQVYGQAFALYGLSEYAGSLAVMRADIKEAQSVMNKAVELFECLEEKAHERVYGGYVEARARNWQPTADLKLSEKDIDCDKSMNTNLHVLEALTCFHKNLCTVYPEKNTLRRRVGEALSEVILVILGRIVGDDYHLDLYFDNKWNVIGPDIISFGHDIETSWLLREAIDETGDPLMKKQFYPDIIHIAQTAYEQGFDRQTGGFENEIHSGKRDRTRVWWNQAEALIGFYNAWEMTGSEHFREAAEGVWSWIEKYQSDWQNGDWFASVSAGGIPDAQAAKGGNWKTSYHNARCCMEILKRLKHKEK